MTVRIMRTFITTALAAIAISSPASAFETPAPKAAAVFLGKAASGSNYTVKPTVRSDGAMRIFDVDTPYGAYKFVGVDFAKLRLHELAAVAVLEKMSHSKAFGKALERAAVAPVKFGFGLLANPVGVIGKSLDGVANTVDRFGAGIKNHKASRDPMLDSLFGVSDAQRELAVELDVDPYSDFPPLKTKLRKMAQAMASGGLPVKAGLAMIPGGAGHIVSAITTASKAKDSLRDKTAAQVIAESRAILLSLKVPAKTVSRLVENRHYTPADLLIMAHALEQLRARNTTAFVDVAARAGSRNAAFYQRRRAELLARHNKQLGGISSFVVVAGQPINQARSGDYVAAFTYDDIAWTKRQQRLFSAMASEFRRGKSGKAVVLATAGTGTATAAGEIRKLGWTIVPLR